VSELEEQLKHSIRELEIELAQSRSDLGIAESRWAAAEQALDTAQKLVEMMRAILEAKQ
jgi:hypothetical protein